MCIHDTSIYVYTIPLSNVISFMVFKSLEPGPRRTDISTLALRKDCVHISALEVEGRHPRALMEFGLVRLEQLIGRSMGIVLLATGKW